MFSWVFFLCREKSSRFLYIDILLQVVPCGSTLANMTQDFHFSYECSYNDFLYVSCSAALHIQMSFMTYDAQWLYMKILISLVARTTGYVSSIVYLRPDAIFDGMLSETAPPTSASSGQFSISFGNPSPVLNCLFMENIVKGGLVTDFLLVLIWAQWSYHMQPHTFSLVLGIYYSLSWDLFLIRCWAL